MKVGFGWSPLDANKISNPGACFILGLLIYHACSNWAASTKHIFEDCKVYPWCINAKVHVYLSPLSQNNQELSNGKGRYWKRDRHDSLYAILM